MEMMLNDVEKQALLKLRKKQNQWPLMRWVLIVLGVLNIFDAASVYLRYHDEALALLASSAGLVSVVLAVSMWHGNPARILLLKLFETQDRS